MELTKENVTALGLHLIPGSGDGVLTYSDGIADLEYEHIDPEKGKGGFQNEINKELKEAIISESEWYENEE